MIFYIVGSFFVQGLNFLTIPVFSRILTPSDFGLYGSYTFWISLTYIFVGVQIFSTINNAIIDFEEKNIYNYVSSICFVGMISFVIFLFLTILFQKYLCNFFEINNKLLIVGVIQAFFMFFLFTITSLYRIQSKPIKYFIYSISNALLNVCLSVIIVLSLNHEKYLGRVYSSLISSVCVGSIAIFVIFKKGKMIYNIKYIKYGLVISVPLIFHSLAGVIFGRLDQWMLLKLIGANASGIYDVASQFGLIVYAFYTACNQAFVPWYFKQYSLGNINIIQKTSKQYIYILTLFFSIIILVFPEILKIMSTYKYRDAIYLSPLMLFGYFVNFLYTFPSNYEFYNKKTAFISLGTLLATILNVILNFILIPLYNSIGAAISTVISYLGILFLHYFIANRIIGNYEIKKSIFIVPIIFMICVLCFYYLMIDYLIFRCVFIFVIFVFLIEIFLKKYLGVLK
jgi:O-antigen/teichoic acid export membrane protein